MSFDGSLTLNAMEELSMGPYEATEIDSSSLEIDDSNSSPAAATHAL